MLSPLFTRKKIVTWLVLLYAAGAIPSAWNVVTRTQASTKAIEQILVSYNMKNEGTKALERFTDEHPILGIFIY